MFGYAGALISMQAEPFPSVSFVHLRLVPCALPDMLSRLGMGRFLGHCVNQVELSDGSSG